MSDLDESIPFAEARALARANRWREKCLVYVTRRPDEILVLEHTDEYPTAGVQVPAGGVDPGEAPHTTALRELAEETGLHLPGPATHLESRIWPTDDAPSRIRHYYWLGAPSTTPDRWSHRVSGTDGDRGMLFWLSFRSRIEHGLTPGYGWESGLGALAVALPT